jgi:16S rRNA processing protein RimM
MIEKKNLFEIGHFGKSHGIKGEITLITSFKFPDLHEDIYIVCELDGILIPFFIESIRTKSADSVFIKFENMDSEKDVKILTGESVYVPDYMIRENFQEKPPLKKIIIGYKVIDKKQSLKGVVTQYDNSTENKLLMVNAKGKDIIIPLSFSKFIDFNERTISIDLPEGFMDI